MSTVTYPCGCVVSRSMFNVDDVGERPIMFIHCGCSKHLRMIQTVGYEMIAQDLTKTLIGQGGRLDIEYEAQG